MSAAAVGREVRGPTALGHDRRRFLNLVFALAVTDFKLRFFGSVLGYVWQLMRPLLLFAVLYAVFSVEFDNVFAPGRLYVTPWMLHDGGAPIIDRRRRLVSAMNTAAHRSGGLVDLPAVTRYERGASVEAPR